MQDARRPHVLLAEAVVEHAHDPEADVEADEVGELERAHRVVQADPRAGVDVLGRAEALLEGAHRLGEERHQDPVDDEPGPVRRHDDLLAERGRTARGSPPRSRRPCRWPRMSSISGMTGTGLKKCMPDEPAAPLLRDGLGQAVDRDRRRVRGEDRARRRDAIELAPERRLDREVLEDGLDDEVGVARRPRCPRSARSGRASRPAPRRSACPWRRPGRGCRRSGRGRPPPGRGPARTGPRRGRSRHGPGRCRGPSAPRRPRRPAGSSSACDLPAAPPRVGPRQHTGRGGGRRPRPGPPPWPPDARVVQVRPATGPRGSPRRASRPGRGGPSNRPRRRARPRDADRARPAAPGRPRRSPRS